MSTTVETPFFLTNGRVAWDITKRIGRLFLDRYYMEPEGWKVVDKESVRGWRRGRCGELRSLGVRDGS
jgi:hypothetical protein